MPSSHHYTSTNSVSSLSISSMSSCSSDSDFDSETGHENGSQHTSLTSWSKKAGNRRRTASTTSWYGRPPNAKGSPSPLVSRSEGEDEDGEDGLRIVTSGIGSRSQRKRYDTVRPAREPPVVEYHRCRDSVSNSAALPAVDALAHQSSTVMASNHVLSSYSSRAVPSNPTTFSRYFPGNRPLTISHPPTEDGNLNLSVNAPTENGPITLFHLRMHNLKAREFSLRRYGRESGREICKSTRKQRRAPGTQKQSQKKQEQNKASGRQRRGSTAQSVARSFSGILGKQTRKERRGSDASTRPVIVHQTQTPQSSHSRSRSNPISPISPSSQPSPISPAKPADLRRVDSGYSSGGNGSPSPSWHIAAAEAKAGCLRDSGLEHLEEEPEDLDTDMRGAYFDMPEDLDLDDEAEDEETATVFQDTYLPKDTIKLEFSNYTHLDLRRRGPMAGSKRYEFEYWGVKYTWKRVLQPHRRVSVAAGSPSLESPRQQEDQATKGHQEAETAMTANVELHLHCPGMSRPVAIIAPEQLSPREAADEAAMGSWVPPSTMRILGEELYAAHNAADVCDVVMATGLVALTDDRVRQHWHESRGLFERLPKLSTGNWSRIEMKMFSPKRLGLGKSDERGEYKQSSNSPSSEESQLDELLRCSDASIDGRSRLMPLTAGKFVKRTETRTATGLP